MGKVYVLFLVCCLVCEFGVDLVEVFGFGLKNCILKEDIQFYVKYELLCLKVMLGVVVFGNGGL